MNSDEQVLMTEYFTLAYVFAMSAKPHNRGPRRENQAMLFNQRSTEDLQNLNGNSRLRHANIHSITM